VEHAFRTAPNQPINPATDDLGTLGGQNSLAVSINSSGQVIGQSQDASGENRAFRTAPNKPINRRTDDLGVTNAFPYDIDDSGRVVGSVQGRGFRTGPNSPLNPVTDYLPHVDGSAFAALGINKAGDLVGTYYADGGNYPSSAILKSGAMAAQGYSVVPIAFLGLGMVGGLNDQDQIAMGVNEQAYLWDSGTLTPVAPPNSWADCVNNAGHVVGSMNAVAFLYVSGVTYDLNSLIPPNSGWTLFEATGINDLDQIAGYGQINGETHEFRLDPAQ
jgi:probable HAF family extracellular repeat protein